MVRSNRRDRESAGPWVRCIERISHGPTSSGAAGSDTSCEQPSCLEVRRRTGIWAFRLRRALVASARTRSWPRSGPGGRTARSRPRRSGVRRTSGRRWCPRERCFEARWRSAGRAMSSRDLHHPHHRGERDHARAASPDAGDLAGGGIRALALRSGCPARAGTRGLARDAQGRSPGEQPSQRRPRLRCSAWNRVVAWTVALAPAMAHIAGTR